MCVGVCVCRCRCRCLCALLCSYRCVHVPTMPWIPREHVCVYEQCMCAGVFCACLCADSAVCALLICSLYTHIVTHIYIRSWVPLGTAMARFKWMVSVSGDTHHRRFIPPEVIQ